MMYSNKQLLLLITTTWCIATATPSAAFVVQPSSSQQQQQSHQRALSYFPASASTSSRSRLMVVADAEQEEKNKQRRNRDDDDDNDNDWVPTATGGWFSPYLTRRLGKEQPPEQQAQAQQQSPTSSPAAAAPAPSIPKPSKRKNQLMTEVKTMQEYKDEVVDEQDAIVCVRFYAPWCRACKAIEAPYKQLARKYSSASESSDHTKVQRVKFVQVPLTKENAYLHTGLGIPSLPYAHIYHPVAGLVEERSINKKIFGEFKAALQCYVDGECVVDWDSESSNIDEKAAQTEEPLQ
jgi:thiol-disulfide isomerase/thioredoxin